MTPAVVVATGATKRYGEVLGLNGFTAEFGPGITGLVGPNGAGKSTFFRVLAGQLHLDSGSVMVLGRPASRPVRSNHEIGYCPESPTLYEWMTAEEFLRMLLRLDGFERAEADRRCASALAEVDLLPVKDRKLAGFSRGMRQRVKIAQALAHDPTLLLLDEPLNALDPVSRVHLLELFTRIAQAGRHIILSSHVLYEVERLTDQIVMMSNGRAIAQGDLHQIRDLIDARPHTVEVTTPVPRELGKALAGWEHVTDVSFPGPDKVVAQTRSPDAFYRALGELARTGTVPVRGVRGVDDNLEAVFRLLAG
ncbi:MAG: ABC transporter ATP-binding protein [Thermoplasmata archaeon]|nr:ABC transporter ATP-binding protein [Thermoplasmata archaeon]